MKKSLFALAVLSTVAGMASAQTNVTIYGIADIGIQSNSNGGPNGRVTGVSSGGQSSSRIGFKGTEDLGNGLKANFVLENGFNTDDGTLATANTLFSRASTVGLSGGFGAVNMGRQQTLLKDAYTQIDPFSAGGVGNIERIFFNTVASVSGTTGIVTYLGNPDGGRTSNSIKYTSPSFSGFNGQASYKFGETAGDTTANGAYSLSLAYVNGPLNVQFVHNNTDVSNTTAPFALQSKAKNTFLGAVYDFGAFKLHGAIANNIVDYPAVTEKGRNALVGVTVPFGAFSLVGSYAINNVTAPGVSDGNSQQIAIGLSYYLSKRTNLYTGYALTKNGNAANLGGQNLSPANTVAAGNNASMFNVGIRHLF